MPFRRFFLYFSLSTVLIAADKSPREAQSGDEAVDLTGSVLAGKKAVEERLGHDPGMDLIVINVKVRPKGDNRIAVSLDDFLLISRKDGQRSQPLAPSQIAGSSALVVSSSGGNIGRSSGIGNNNRGPIWGGMPGSGTRPERIGGDDVAIGSASGGEAKATVQKGDSAEENPLLAALKDKILPQGETGEQVSGLLYFFFEGKHKPKHLDLIYTRPNGRLILNFER